MDKNTEDWLWAAGFAGLVGMPQIGIPLLTGLVAWKCAVRPMGKAISWTAASTAAAAKNIASAREARVSQEAVEPSTKAERVEQAKKRFREHVALIASMPLKKHHKRAMRIQAVRRLLGEMREIMDA